MEKVLEEWHEKCDLIYLFANQTVLEMYPKFGFSRVKEYEHFKIINKNADSPSLAKLDMDVQSNRDMLYRYTKNSGSFEKIAMSENADLVMFYCISFLKENFYYIKSLDVIAIATFNDNQLHLWDVFGEVKVELDKVIATLAKPQVNEVVLGFTPENCSSYEVREITGHDVLFVQKDKAKFFNENKVIFPLLSHA